MIVHKLQELVKKALKQDAKVSFEHPENPEHGDYSTNVALLLGQQTKENPRDIAEKLKESIKKSKSVSKIEVAGPGFVNFFLSQEYLLKELQEIVKQKEKYGKGKNQRKKIMVEFTDPNPFKEFHIGHLYSNIVGESLSRLLEATGARVKRANYQGDVGLHVARAIWGMTQIPHRPKERDPLSAKTKWLGMCYAAGALKEDEKKEKELGRINQAVYDRSDKKVNKLYDTGRRWSLQYFEEIYKRLGTKFDYYYFESDAAKAGKKIVEQGIKKGIFKKSQGAVVFPGEKHGLHTRVFINSVGLPTYEAKELGLAPTKYKDFAYDLSLIITGNEIIDYFKVLLTALAKINPSIAEKTKHLSHGMVRLPEGKMSSRTGNIVTAEQLIGEVKKRALHIMESSRSDIPKAQQQATAEIIAVGAIKYSLLRVGLGKDIIFDFDKSLSLEGESGPYLQYTYARCRSILRQVNLAKLSFPKLSLAKFSKEEEKLLRLLYRLPEVVESAAQNFSPNLVASFVFDVAQAYNNFYNTHRVLQAETKEVKHFRLLLTGAVAQIIQNSLYLLGMKTPERM